MVCWKFINYTQILLISELSKLAYKSKPKQVEVMALPLLWDSVKNSAPDVDNKKATQYLAKTLAKLVRNNRNQILH